MTHFLWTPKSASDVPDPNPTPYDLEVLDKVTRFVCRAYQKLDVYYEAEEKEDKKRYKELLSINQSISETKDTIREL